MKIRLHVGSLDDSMTTVEEIDATLAAARDYLARTYWPMQWLIEQNIPATLRVEPYGYDERIGWDTHIILLNGSPAGWTNAPVVG